MTVAPFHRPSFGWISLRPTPRHCNLTRCGWVARGARWSAAQEPDVVVIDTIWIDTLAHIALLTAAPDQRRRMLWAGVRESRHRAALMAAGFADAMPRLSTLEELAERAMRVLRGQASTIRRAGPLMLDLELRDALDNGRRLHLLPREFAILWRLAAPATEPLRRTGLLREVWGLEFDPGTNSVEVHISRLRSKLARIGLRGLIVTLPNGGYALDHQARAPAH